MTQLYFSEANRKSHISELPHIVKAMELFHMSTRVMSLVQDTCDLMEFNVEKFVFFKKAMIVCGLQFFFYTFSTKTKMGEKVLMFRLNTVFVCFPASVLPVESYKSSVLLNKVRYHVHRLETFLNHVSHNKNIEKTMFM